jgi:integral membrane protein
LDKTLQRFKLVAFLEGVSFLLLLFVAMPLKYMMGMAIATKIIGMIHGILFILFLVLLYQASQKENWDNKFIGFAFLMSLLPFGTFFLDKRLKAMVVDN